VASLEFEGVSKSYGASVQAVCDLTLAVRDAEFVVVVGPSGCGKTTALRMLAGLEEITSGEIRIAGKRVNHVPPRDRDIAMVFQNYALYPHMNVYDNIGYGLRVRRVPKAARRARIEETAAILGLSKELRRKPSQLSGGQRQRVAMGRAIVRQPQAFLMDEPLSNLDARLRVQMRTEIARLQRELEITTVYVTHDQLEAMTMADRVAVLRDGVLQQFDTPQRVYNVPANVFVASFIGSPAMNLVEGRLLRGDRGVGCLIGSHTIPVPDRVLADQPTLARAIGQTIAVGIRPEAISADADDGNGLPGTVVVSEELGSEVISHIEVDAVPVQGEAVRHRRAAEVVEAETSVTEPRSVKTIIIARLPGEAGVTRGTRLSLAFDANKLHFFDLSTGETLRTN
jgi:multiple sugar transport system ATP-binding protein